MGARKEGPVRYGEARWFARVLGLGAALGLVVSHLGCGSDTIIVLPTGTLPGQNINGNGNQIGDNNTAFPTPTPTPTRTGV
jgi:hypothetical protein